MGCSIRVGTTFFDDEIDDGGGVSLFLLLLRRRPRNPAVSPMAHFDSLSLDRHSYTTGVVAVVASSLFVGLLSS